MKATCKKKMKKQRIVKIITFIFVIVLLNMNNSYAAIQIKDTTDSVLTNKTISEFYDMAEEMKNAGQGLEGTTVDVKMSNNYEWAVVSYFSNSSYGTGGVGKNTGISFDTDVKNHYSTNGNITGVMDLGKTTSFTAGIIASYSGKELTTVGGQSIINNAGTSSVDKFIASGESQDFSIAKTGWYSSRSRAYQDTEYPYSTREGIFGFWGGADEEMNHMKRYRTCRWRCIY